jgi:hypothetical protein
MMRDSVRRNNTLMKGHLRRSYADIANHLVREYGLSGALELVLIPQGSAANYHVSSRQGQWLFKVFQSDYTVQQIEIAGRLVQFLIERGYPTSPFLQSTSGASVTQFDAQAAILLPWVSGMTDAPNTVSDPRRMRELGALCGRLHQVAQGFPEAPALEVAHPHTCVPKALEKLERLKVEARHTPDPELVRGITARQSILADLGAELASSQQAAVRSVIHGDYYCSHLVWRAGRPAAVIDVLGKFYFVGWELMRGFFQSVPPLAQLLEAALERLWRECFEGYRQQFAFPPEQIMCAYDTYLLQLTASTHGLVPQHPDADERARQQRSFGLWRTETARQLAMRRSVLRRFMARS